MTQPADHGLSQATATDWLPPPGAPSLRSGEVHVWRAGIDLPPGQITRLKAVLSPDERLRAERFRFERHRFRYIAARGLLREILGMYLAAPARDLQFHYSPQGKPKLAESRDGGAIEFNVSHSGDLALVAVGRGSALGVDLEWMRPGFSCLPVAERYFARSECAHLKRIAPERQSGFFFRLWTAKEACLKAMGCGLGMLQNGVELDLSPDDSLRLVTIAGDPATAARWSLLELNVAPGYAAALAVAGPLDRICRWRWEDRSEDCDT